MISEAYAIHGSNYNSFAAWWDAEETWGESELAVARKPYPLRRAYEYKRLDDFRTGALSGRRISNPKSLEGFSANALIELSAPKYVKDRHQNEYDAEGKRTEESVERGHWAIDYTYRRVLPDRLLLR